MIKDFTKIAADSELALVMKKVQRCSTAAHAILNPVSPLSSLTLASIFAKDLDVKKVGRQVILGNYANEEDITWQGTVIEIGLGFTNADIFMDVRDIIYDVTNWEWSWKHFGQTTLDAIGLVPVVGVLKYSDEAFAVIKRGLKSLGNTDEAAALVKRGLKSLGNTDEAASLLRNLDELSDAASSTISHLDETADSIKSGIKNGEGVMESTLKKTDFIVSENGIVEAVGDGQHVFQKHIGKTDQDLVERLVREKMLRGKEISASSSFANDIIANEAANNALIDSNNISKINKWLNSSDTNNLAIKYYGNTVVGRRAARVAGEINIFSVTNRTDATVVLKKNNKGGYFILTAHPGTK